MAAETTATSNRGWTVTLAATGINLALGVLYSWSVISKAIPKEWGWDEAQKALPYTIACLFFAFMMVPAGKLQDKFGPRMVAALGGIFVGAGFILASRFTTIPMYIIFFGVLAGTGIGFGYASATPPAIKWFPAAKTGLIAGIVVAGFGLASVYTAPLSNYLIGQYGVPNTMMALGIAFLVVVVILAQLLKNPPAPVTPAATSATAAVKSSDYSAKEVLSTYQFYMLWLMYAFNAGAGLMVIGKLAIVVQEQSGYKGGFLMVALLAIGNAGGRVFAGVLSDKIGRVRTLQIFTLVQAALMFLTPSMDDKIVLAVFSTLIGMCYGSNLSVFPSLTKDFFGIKNFGVNYGMIFTAWGVGSTLTLVCGIIYERTKCFQMAFFLSGALLIVSIILSFTIKKPTKA
ncbi:MAG: OFA family MFS transporter [Planctomycetes bacterium]|nr:OFA family MFS transporter [Planctomycetota bacterium]